MEKSVLAIVIHLMFGSHHLNNAAQGNFSFLTSRATAGFREEISLLGGMCSTTDPALLINLPFQAQVPYLWLKYGSS
jgi:hypothetical protein